MVVSMSAADGSTAALIGAVGLVALSGLFSGLNLGLMSFTEDDLGLIIDGSADRKEVAYARAIIPIRRQGNLLLCTLLLGNTLVNAVIAILLSDLTSGLIGTIMTTALILVFGEIIPQSFCSRHALFIGNATLPIVRVFIFACYPIAYPISMLLDRLLGREISGVFSRQGLLALVKLNVEDAAHAAESGLTAADMKLVSGALTYQDQTVEDVMTPLEDCFTLPIEVRPCPSPSKATLVFSGASHLDLLRPPCACGPPHPTQLMMQSILDRDTIMAILARGHTRIPVYDGAKSHIVALLFSKDLLGIGFERALPLRVVLDSFQARKRVHYASKHMKLNDALAQCQRDRVHMLLVVPNDVTAASVGGVTADVAAAVVPNDVTAASVGGVTADVAAVGDADPNHGLDARADIEGVVTLCACAVEHGTYRASTSLIPLHFAPSFFPALLVAGRTSWRRSCKSTSLTRMTSSSVPNRSSARLLLPPGHHRLLLPHLVFRQESPRHGAWPRCMLASFPRRSLCSASTRVFTTRLH